MTAEADHHPVDPRQLRSHADNLDALRGLLADVRQSVTQLGQQWSDLQTSYGWRLTGLGDRYVRQEELIDYIEENLFLIIRDFRQVADGEQELKQVIRRDDDVATIDGTPVIDQPSFSLAGCMDSAIARAQSREWVEPQVADAAPVAEFATPVNEFHAMLRAGGLQYATAHIDPIRQLLDDLTTTPDMVASHVTVWRQAGADLQQVSILLWECLDQDFPHRDRLDVRSYLALMAHNVEALIGLAKVCIGMAVIMECANSLILLTRDIIRGIIGDLFARVVVWIAESRAAIPRSVLASRLGIILASTWRIHAYIDAMTTSIITLSLTVDG